LAIWDLGIADFFPQTPRAILIQNPQLQMPPLHHLYFHIPFCPKLCPYCSFYVETGAKHKNLAFIDALLTEVERASEHYDIKPETVYFGGGTPSALLVDQLDYLFEGLNKRLKLEPGAEFTFEANPATVRIEKARLLKAAGVNRISLGVQSWHDRLLKTLGRVHSAEQAEKTYGILREAGFENINIDLMFSVPGQIADEWQQTLEKTISLAPQHVSTYCLTYEEDTEYFRKLTGGEFRQDIELDATLFETTMDVLSAGGFGQYEISNYARPGFESRHNQAYWAGADYLGFGPSAFSTVGGRRWETIRNTEEYVRRVQAGEDTVSFREELSPEKREGETIAFAMRTSDGVPLSRLAPWKKEMEEFQEAGLLEPNGDTLRLTRRGKLLADEIAVAFV